MIGDWVGKTLLKKHNAKLDVFEVTLIRTLVFTLLSSKEVYREEYSDGEEVRMPRDSGLK